MNSFNLKESSCNAGDAGSVPGSGRSSGEGNGNPLLYSCLENPMDRGPWQATVHGVSKGQTRLSDSTSSLHFFLVLALKSPSSQENSQSQVNPESWSD